MVQTIKSSSRCDKPAAQRLTSNPTLLTPSRRSLFASSATGTKANDWNSIVEVAAIGCGVLVEKPAQPVLTERKGRGLFGPCALMCRPARTSTFLAGTSLHPLMTTAMAKPTAYMKGSWLRDGPIRAFFYTDPVTGGMVFRSTPTGAKTSKNTNYTRSELRGMLRRGDETIATRIDGGFPNKNNWVFSSAPLAAQAQAAGVDGVLRATLAVNQVTRQGKAYQIGRVIIGQIHAKDDEPIRLYYRKLPKNKYGSIYFAHEPAIGKEQWVEVIGSRADQAQNPDDGIALDEVFSYEIEAKGTPEGDKVIPMLHLKIIRDDGPRARRRTF